MLMVSIAGELTDYRNLGAPTIQEAGITRERPEPESALRAMILQGEGLTTEFKSQIPEGKKNDQKLPFLKTVAAFASGGGGSIIFGVAEHGRLNEGAIVGIDVAHARERITNMLRDTIDPYPAHYFLVAELDGKHVIAVTIAGDGIVHGVFPDNPQYFVRRGATTFPAKVSELKEMLRNELGPSVVSRPGWIR
jgi:predicted HTH transcriptional regulator